MGRDFTVYVLISKVQKGEWHAFVADWPGLPVQVGESRLSVLETAEHTIRYYLADCVSGGLDPPVSNLRLLPGWQTVPILITLGP